jgi:hypothetical protein
MTDYFPNDLIFGPHLVARFAAAGEPPANDTKCAGTPLWRDGHCHARKGVAHYRNVYAMIDAPHSEWMFRGVLHHTSQLQVRNAQTERVLSPPVAERIPEWDSL